MRNSEGWDNPMKGCKVKGLGYAKAKRKVTNDELSTYVDTNHEWIQTDVYKRQNRYDPVPESEIFPQDFVSVKEIAPD